MTVARTYANHETRYELRDQTGPSCVLSYTADNESYEPATWKILKPGPGGTEDLYAAEQFSGVDDARLRSWLSPLIGSNRAAELVDAVDAEPPAAA